MNKLKLTTLLLGGALSVNAQSDTTCTMITQNKVFKFDYYTSQIIKENQVDSVNNIKVKANEVLVLHLYTKKIKKYKVVTIHEGHPHEQYLQSKDNEYTVNGPANVIVFTK